MPRPRFNPIKALARIGRGLILKRKFRGEVPTTRPSVAIQIDQHVYTRYLYILAKFFSLNGYDVFIIASPSVYSRIYTCSYSKLLFKERIIRSSIPKYPDLLIEETQTINKAKKRLKLSPNYFAENKERSYRIPMSQHPSLYHEDLWNKPVTLSEKKINGCITYGNFDPKIYHEIRNDDIFPVCDRTTLRDYLVTLPFCHLVSDLAELTTLDFDRKLVIIDTSRVKIPLCDLRPTLARFRYFLSIPGAAMPQSHNTTEAMSTNCVPIIEGRYAQDFEPRLDNGITCLTFCGLEGAAKTIERSFHLSEDEHEKMSEHVRKLYEQELTPRAVISKIEVTEAENIFLQAEHYSVALLKSKRLRAK